MTIISSTRVWRPLCALPSLQPKCRSRLRSLAQSMPLRPAAGIANTRRARVFARAPSNGEYSAPNYGADVKDLGSVVGDVWTGLAEAGRDRIASFPRGAYQYQRAALFCLGAVVAFVLAAVVRKVLILLTFRAGNVNPSQHNPQGQESRSREQRPGPGQPDTNQEGRIKPQQRDGGANIFMEDRDTELNDMTEVMQHAARKVAVMQQVVDAAKRRLQDEMECSRCLKDEAASLKTQISSLSKENQKFEQQYVALEVHIQRIEGHQNVSNLESRRDVLGDGTGKGHNYQHRGAANPDMALSGLLLASQSERGQLATVLSASEERTASLQSQLNVAREQVFKSEQLSCELRERLDAAEAAKLELVTQVEQLTCQQAVAQDESAQRDESIKMLQQQLAQMKQQMDASSTTLQALEDGSQDQVTQAESKVDSLQGELEQVQMGKAAADEAAQQAVHKLAEYERGIVKCVSSILEGKPERTEKVCAASTEPWWGLPDAQLGEFLGSQQVRLQEAALHKHAIWNTLPMRAKQEADKLEQDVQDAIQQRLAQSNDGEGVDSSVLEAQQRRTEGKLRDHLERHMSNDQFITYQALTSECSELEQRSTNLSRALEVSLAERMLQLLAGQMSLLQEAAGLAAQQQATKAEAQDRLQALAKALALRQNAVEEQEAQLLQRQDVLEVKAVASQDHDNYIKELSEQTQQKAGALSVQEQELNQLDQTLKKRESRLVAQVQRLDAQIQREEHEEVRQAETVGSTVDAAEAEANRLKVASLQEELGSLKEMYSRQFVASKQELDAAQDRIQQLRRQQLRPHNGVDPSTDRGAELYSGRTPDDLSSGHSGTVPDSEVSAWASDLITKVSRTPPDGPAFGTDASRQHGAIGVPEHQAGVMLHARTSTLERELVTTTEEEAVPDKVKELRLDAVGFCVPHPAKVDKGGEDAHFVLGSSAIGVADGVGGWCKSGVDPGEYSRQLMQFTEEAIRGDAAASCVQALEYAHSRVNMPGSSTAIVAKLRSDYTLEIANLGDSGLRIVRDGQIAFATDSLQHGFNMPFQLGNKNLIPYTDVPKSSLQSVVTVLPGDVIVMASDGFFDNIWDQDLARLVKHSCLIEEADQEDCVANMAEQLALVAANNSQDKMYRSPWSVECSKQSDSVGLLRKLFPRGGKVDDITVVLARVE